MKDCHAKNIEPNWVYDPEIGKAKNKSDGQIIENVMIPEWVKKIRENKK